MNRALSLAAIITAFTAIPATAHEWSSFDREKMLNFMMNKLDADSDGYINASEHEDASRKMFIQADTNDDGYVVKQELSDYVTREREQAGVPRYSEPTVVTNPHPRKR
jgi:Ca2+-binding EF-hand superfamily protein